MDITDVVTLVRERQAKRLDYEREGLMFDPWFDVDANRAFVEMVETVSVIAGRFTVAAVAPRTRAGRIHGAGTASEILDVDLAGHFPNAHIFTTHDGYGASLVLNCPCDMH